jgi:hypothetical protein
MKLVNTVRSGKRSAMRVTVGRRNLAHQEVGEGAALPVDNPRRSLDQKPILAGAGDRFLRDREGI